MTTSAHSEFLAFAALSAAFVVKQFLADFPLQSNWMARGKERANGYLGPLFAHAGVHGFHARGGLNSGGVALLVAALDPLSYPHEHGVVRVGLGQRLERG
jgi:hypothetical protein